MTKTIRIGSGAGYAGDRLEPSLELIEKGNLDYISYECLAERTIAIGQQAKLKDPSKGYNGLLEHRMEKALPLCWKHKVKLITNMGSANPAGRCPEVRGDCPQARPDRHEDRLRHRRRSAARHQQVHGRRGVGDSRTSVQAARRDRLRQRLHGRGGHP